LTADARELASRSGIIRAVTVPTGQPAVLSDLSQLTHLVPAWRQLFRCCPDATVFQHPGWVLPWLERYGGRRRTVVVVLHDTDDRLAALAPLMIDTVTGQLQFIGHPLNDRNGVLALPGWQAAAWRAVATALIAHASGGCKLPEMTETQIAACLTAGVGRRRSPAQSSPIIVLPATWRVYESQFSVHRRKSWQRAERRLVEHGAVRFESLSGAALSGNHLVAFHVDRLRRFRRAGRLSELSSVEGSREFGDFLGAVASGLADDDMLHLGRLCVGDHPAAQNLYLNWPGVVMDYMQTFDPALGACSPGMLGLLAGIRRCIAAGTPLFDFGRGDEAYKFVLGARVRDLAGVEG
jgi:CelD/BcsL family acetyltransferase involved in cellulose biosynthesis